jgi:hypothetical protein
MDVAESSLMTDAAKNLTCGLKNFGWSIMTAAEQLVKQLELARRDLLELSSTNRLLTTPRNSDDGTAIEIMDESTTEIYRMLVLENAKMRFEEGELADDDAAVASGDSGTVAGAEEQDAAPRTIRRRTTKKRTRKASAEDALESGVSSSESDVFTVRSVNQLSGESRAGNSTNEEPIRTLDPGVQKDTSANRKPAEPVSATDEVLHTILAPAELDRRLQALITDAATLMQEQGVNVLYLALGFLRWIHPATPDTPRAAPLILVPVTLDRGRAEHRYAVASNEGEIETNLTLKTRLKNDFGITLPDIPDHDDLSPAVYFVNVENAIAGQRGWKVLKDDVTL